MPKEFKPERDYNASVRSRFTLAEARGLVGATARLPLTGRFVDAGEGPAGTYIVFEVDQRWGLTDRPVQWRFDIEAFDKVDIRTVPDAH